MSASVSPSKTTPSQTQAEPISPKGCTNFKLRQVTRLVSNHCEASSPSPA